MQGRALSLNIRPYAFRLRTRNLSPAPTVDEYRVVPIRRPHLHEVVVADV